MIRSIMTLSFCSILGSCGQSSGGGDAGSSARAVTVNTQAAAYVQDTDANDNLTLVKTVCNLTNAQASMELYYTSELLGSGYYAQSSLTLPSSDKWVDGKYTRADNSTNCNAPGYRSITASDLTTAQAGTVSGMKFLYGCGGTCELTLKSKDLATTGYYKSFTVEWACTAVQANSLAGGGNFGSSIDTQIGKATCP